MSTDASPISSRPTRWSIATRRTPAQRARIAPPISRIFASAIGACASYSRNFTGRPSVWLRTIPEKMTTPPAPGSSTVSAMASGERGRSTTVKMSSVISPLARTACGSHWHFRPFHRSPQPSNGLRLALVFSIISPLASPEAPARLALPRPAGGRGTVGIATIRRHQAQIDDGVAVIGMFDHFTARLAGGTGSARTATAHRREQAELVVGGEAVIGFDVVVADREEGVRAVAREIGMAGDDRFPGRLDGPSLGA